MEGTSASNNFRQQNVDHIGATDNRAEDQPTYKANGRADDGFLGIGILRRTRGRG